MHAATRTLDDPAGEPDTELLRALFRASPAPMVVTDTAARIRHANPAFEQACGYTLAELVGRRPSMLRTPLQSDEFYRRMWHALQTRGRWHGEIWNRHKDGRVSRDWLAIVALRDAAGHATHYVGTYAGLAMPHLVQGRGADVGGIDAVTGVLTRRGFIAAVERLHRSLGRLSVVTLDIARFTELNEQFGLDCGDMLLRQVALRCTQVAAASGGHCVVGRVGPDEFALALAPEAALRGAAADGWVQRIAVRLREAVARSYELDAEHKVAVDVSLGVAVLEAGGGNAAEVLLHASAARQDATADGGHLLHYHAHAGQRQLTRALREAIVADRIEIALQPKVQLCSGAIAGFEALARWTGPDGQPVSPGEFIPLAERRGMIAELGDRVLERALRTLSQWREAGRPLLPLAVNFSASQFHRHDAVARVEQAIARHGLPTRLVELELTESVLLGDVHAALGTLEALRALGLGLSIDDFGTGYSSLAYLRRFPVDCLKIDRSFVAELTTDRRTRQIVRSIIELTHQFGLRCVAEGIETVEQLALLRRLGCDEGQGYLFARPAAPEAMTDLLAGPLPWAPMFAPGAAAATTRAGADDEAPAAGRRTRRVQRR